MNNVFGPDTVQKFVYGEVHFKIVNASMGLTSNGQEIAQLQMLVVDTNNNKMNVNVNIFANTQPDTSFSKLIQAFLSINGNQTFSIEEITNHTGSANLWEHKGYKNADNWCFDSPAPDLPDLGVDANE